MLRQFARLSFRKSLHSQAGTSLARYTRSVYALGASVTVAGYVAWSWHSNSRHISLDSEAVSAPKKQSLHPAVLKPSDAPTPSTPSSDEHALVTEPSAVPPETATEGEGAQEESSGGAFNPETGEINWDCPCLGGMAHGPCGQQFRDAFSCFVYSQADPKGIDCVEKFKTMQDCFREHPDVYGDEIMDDDDDEPLAGSATTEQTDDESHLSNPESPPTETTE